MTSVATLQVAQWVAHTEAEGPGRRFALWLQGCPLRCPGCCNPEMLPFAGGRAMTVDAVLAEIDDDHDGITLLGGEPFAQAGAAATLCESVRARGLSVMIFSGFTREALERKGPEAVRLLAACDLLVDGPYLQGQPDDSRRYIGSRNQRMHHLTPRHEDDPRLAGADTIELRLTRDGLVVNGWPSPADQVREPPHEGPHEG